MSRKRYYAEALRYAQGKPRPGPSVKMSFTVAAGVTYECEGHIHMKSPRPPKWRKGRLREWSAKSIFSTFKSTGPVNIAWDPS
jgi:hypothetical protein